MDEFQEQFWKDSSCWGWQQDCKNLYQRQLGVIFRVKDVGFGVKESSPRTILPFDKSFALVDKKKMPQTFNNFHRKHHNTATSSNSLNFVSKNKASKI